VFEVPKKITVGVDGSETAGLALEWAAGMAKTTGARLHILHAGKPHHEAVRMGFYGQFTEKARQAVEEAVAQARQLEPGIEVDGEFQEANPVDALLEASKQTDLLVVGSRGLGGFKGLLLGSVSQHIVEHAQCSVAIIRPPDKAPAGG
jgi:nucleotide-binding universal stress UspA family protein